MSQTIWVAAAPNPATPLAATGWVLPAGQSVTITTPNNLNTRFWGRTGCVFNSAGVGHCQTGDCGGLFQCKGWGTIPATLAEVNFDAWDSLDFYDVSMVDGSNLPMYINITKSSGGTEDKISSDGCVPAGCTKPVVCPSVLDVKVGSTVVGCISACARLDTDQLCCRGQYSSRAACNPATWPVDYAAVFKRAEPYAYSYVDDDATSVFTCKGVLRLPHYLRHHPLTPAGTAPGSQRARPGGEPAIALRWSSRACRRRGMVGGAGQPGRAAAVQDRGAQRRPGRAERRQDRGH